MDKTKIKIIFIASKNVLLLWKAANENLCIWLYSICSKRSPVGVSVGLSGLYCHTVSHIIFILSHIIFKKYFLKWSKRTFTNVYRTVTKIAQTNHRRICTHFTINTGSSTMWIKNRILKDFRQEHSWYY